MEDKILVYKNDVEYNRYLTKFKALKKHIGTNQNGN